MLVEPPVPQNPFLTLESTLYIEATKSSLPALLNLHMYKPPIFNQSHFLFNVYLLKKDTKTILLDEGIYDEVIIPFISTVYLLIKILKEASSVMLL